MWNEIINSKIVVTLKQILGEEADLHLVGGVVRDVLLGKGFKDIDIATKLTPEEVSRKILKAGLHCKPVGIRRGTVLAVVEGEPVEITTFRNPAKETEYTKTIEEDLVARDFTINAIAFSLNTEQLIDPYNGQADLKDTLRTVRDPDLRFKEDPHRILRMVRFGPGQGRKISEDTLVSAKKNIELLKEVHMERVYPEIVKILTSNNPRECLSLLVELGAMQILLPEIMNCIGFQQNHYHTLDVFDHISNVVAAAPPTKLARLSALFHDIGKPLSLTIDEGTGRRRFLGHEEVGADITKKVLTRWKAGSSDREDVTKLVALHMKDIRMSKKKIRRLRRDLGELFPEWLNLKKADLLGGGRVMDLNNTLQDEWSEFEKLLLELDQEPVINKPSDLAIKGQDLIELGLKPGPEFGRILKAIDDIVLDDPTLNVREILLEKVKELI